MYVRPRPIRIRFHAPHKLPRIAPYQGDGGVLDGGGCQVFHLKTMQIMLI